MGPVTLVPDGTYPSSDAASASYNGFIHESSLDAIQSAFATLPAIGLSSVSFFDYELDGVLTYFIIDDDVPCDEFHI